LKNWWCALKIVAPCLLCRELKKVENRWSGMVTDDKKWIGKDFAGSRRGLTEVLPHLPGGTE
jgi:hypothetical protein